jgi:hypothetical protein
MRSVDAGAVEAATPKIDPAQVGASEITVGKIDVFGLDIAKVQPSEIEAREIAGGFALAVKGVDLPVTNELVERIVRNNGLAHGRAPVST